VCTSQFNYIHIRTCSYNCISIELNCRSEARTELKQLMATPSTGVQESRIAKAIKDNPIAKGLAVIVGNQHSYHRALRRVLNGPPKDVDSMTSSLQRLHYTVVPLHNISPQDIKQIVEAIKTYFPIAPKKDCYKRIVFVFAGHGDIQDNLHCKDGPVHLKSDIIMPLLPMYCRSLEHIPKLFFIDACRSDPSNVVKRGGPGIEDPGKRLPKLANYYLVQSTQYSEVSLEISKGGCWLYLLAEELTKQDNADKMIQGIITSVNRKLNNKMRTELRDGIRESEDLDDDFSQQPIESSTLHEDIFFLKEAKALEGKYFSIESI